MPINSFGLGIGADDARPFFESDFHMPWKWNSEDYPEGIPPGQRSATCTKFLLFGDGGVLASVDYVGRSQRDHRWEHRPSPQADGGERREDYGRGWVLDLDPNTWQLYNPPPPVDGAGGMSYRYGNFDGESFRQITAADD